MHGYEVFTAQSADDAFVLIGVAAPDVVLLDIEMPLVDGVTVLRRLRETHPHVPVVMVTGNSDVDLARDTLELGAFDYVVKPFDFTHLAHVVEVAVAHRG